MDLVDLMDQARDGVGHFVHVDARWEGVQADGVKLVAVLHRQVSEPREVLLLHSLEIQSEITLSHEIK